MNCIIIEDQPPAQRILKKYINDIGSLTLKATFSNALQAMEYLKAEAVDLIFLDIHLPKMSGIDFLKSTSPTPAVILTTAFPEYALESYEFDVVDYLLKPFSFQRFVKAVSKVPVKPASAPRNDMFIKSGYEHIRINLNDVLYIKSDADYTEVFLPEKKLLSSEPLRYWLECLDPAQFARIHRSYIVNAAKIEKMAGNQLFLTNGIQVPIGRSYKEAFVEKFVL